MRPIHSNVASVLGMSVTSAAVIYHSPATGSVTGSIVSVTVTPATLLSMTFSPVHPSGQRSSPPALRTTAQRSSLPSSSPRGKGCEAAAVLALNLLHRSCAPIGAAMRNSRAGPCLIPRGAAVPRCVVQSGWGNNDGIGSQVQQMKSLALT